MLAKKRENLESSIKKGSTYKPTLKSDVKLCSLPLITFFNVALLSKYAMIVLNVSNDPVLVWNLRKQYDSDLRKLDWISNRIYIFS